MLLYALLKFIHVISSTILFGTGIGTACVMLYGYCKKNLDSIVVTSQYVVLADWIFTGTSGLIQPISGLWMIHLAGYPWSSWWIKASIMGYIIAACCWFPVLYLQIKMRDLAMDAQRRQTALPPRYFRYFRYWFLLGWPAFISLLGVFYLMINKPMSF